MTQNWREESEIKQQVRSRATGQGTQSFRPHHPGLSRLMAAPLIQQPGPGYCSLSSPSPGIPLVNPAGALNDGVGEVTGPVFLRHKWHVVQQSSCPITCIRMCVSAPENVLPARIVAEIRRELDDDLHAVRWQKYGPAIGHCLLHDTKAASSRQ